MARKTDESGHLVNKDNIQTCGSSLDLGPHDLFMNGVSLRKTLQKLTDRLEAMEKK